MKKAISLMLIAALFTTMTVSAAPAAYAAASPSDADSEYVQDEVLVAFEDAPSKQELRSITDEVDAKKVEEVETPTEETPYVVTLDKGESVEDAVQDLEKEKAVAYAQPNYLYSLDDVASGTGAVRASLQSADDTNLWNLNKVNAREAWDLIDEVKGPDAKKVTVAVLDTGVNLEHPDLQAALKKENCVNVVDENDPANYPKLSVSDKNHGDNGGHGTKVSGVIAATSGNGIGVAGVASGNHNDLVELAVIDVYARYNSSKDRMATSADIIKGINYACDTAGAKVINMSLGHYPGDSESNSKQLTDSSGKLVLGTDTLLEQTIRKTVRNKNVTIVCSAGNKNSTVSWLPSDFDDCISVISTVNYSDAYALCKAPSSSYGWKKDISAPGHLVSTTLANGGYTINGSSGTSVAAPVVSGVAAMLYYLKPNISASKVKEVLTTTATDLYIDGDDSYTRCGNVNALAAVSKAVGRSVPSPGSFSVPASVKAASAGYDRIKISWKKMPNVKGYKIYRSTSAAGTFKRVATISKNSTTSYINTGLKMNNTYYYKVQAYGTLADKKAYSPLSAAKSAKPVPETPSVKVSPSTYKSVKLKWGKIRGASGYGIYRSTSKNGKYSYIKRISKGSTTTYTNSGLKPGKNYYYKVRAYRTNASKRIYGNYSSIKQIKATPAKVSISLKKNKRTRKASITWKRASTVNGYVVYRSTSKNGKYKKVATRKTSAKRSFSSKRLKKGKNYYYKVRAYKTYRGHRIYGPYSNIKKCRF